MVLNSAKGRPHRTRFDIHCNVYLSLPHLFNPENHFRKGKSYYTRRNAFGHASETRFETGVFKSFIPENVVLLDK